MCVITLKIPYVLFCMQILVQGNPSNYSYTQLRDRQWVAADVSVCVDWSTTTPRTACCSCTMHCELSCFKHTFLSLFNFTNIANKGMCLYRLTYDDS